MEEYMDNFITLTDDEGVEEEFEIIDIVEYEGEDYAVLLPAEDEENEEVVILKIEEMDEEYDNYVNVEDEETLMAVFEIFKEKYKDEFNFAE